MLTRYTIRNWRTGDEVVVVAGGHQIDRYCHLFFMVVDEAGTIEENCSRAFAVSNWDLVDKETA